MNYMSGGFLIMSIFLNAQANYYNYNNRQVLQLPIIFEACRLSLWSLSSIQEQKAYTR